MDRFDPFNPPDPVEPPPPPIRPPGRVLTLLVVCGGALFIPLYAVAVHADPSFDESLVEAAWQASRSLASWTFIAFCIWLVLASRTARRLDPGAPSPWHLVWLVVPYLNVVASFWLFPAIQRVSRRRPRDMLPAYLLCTTGALLGATITLDPDFADLPRELAYAMNIVLVALMIVFVMLLTRTQEEAVAARLREPAG